MHSQEILDMHNTKSGHIFILGTGPSLIDQLPLLERLKNEVTLGCNTIFKWEDLPFTPTYYGISDVYEQRYIDALAALIPDGTQALNIQWPGYYNNPRFVWVEKAHDSHQVRADGFVGLKDTLPAIPTARTTPLTLAQLTAWMGYREFYLLGMEQTRGYCYNPETLISGIQGNEFPIDKNPKYRIAIRACAKRMREDVEAVGGHVYDCSPGGLLNYTGHDIHMGLPPMAPVLEYKPLEEVLDVLGR
jgi:hypothetical protein